MALDKARTIEQTLNGRFTNLTVQPDGSTEGEFLLKPTYKQVVSKPDNTILSGKFIAQLAKLKIKSVRVRQDALRDKYIYLTF